MMKQQRPPTREHAVQRRGAFMVLGFFTLIATIAFVAFSIDTGNIALNKTIMQNGVDAAALAAAMEITNAVENAPPEETDPTAYAREQAKVVAADTAAMNAVYVDPSLDVEFGLRWFNPATEKFEIQWGVEPANAVKVKARRDNDDLTQPDAKLPMLFAGVLGDNSVEMGAEAIAYIESRDISVVLDFSGSMRYDSLFFAESVNKLGASAIQQNLEDMYMQLGMTDGEVGTLDHIDPDNSGSVVNGAAKYLTIHGPAPNTTGEAQIDVTFKYGEVYVTSTKNFKQIKLEYSHGNRQTFSGLNQSSGTFYGTGGYSGDEIDEVWVTYEIPNDGTVSGELNGGSCSPDATLEFTPNRREVEITIDSNDFTGVRLNFTNGSSQLFWDWNGGSAEGRNVTLKGTGSYDNRTISEVGILTDCDALGWFDAPDTGSTTEKTEYFADSNWAVKNYFGLNSTSYPFNRGSWDSYINYVRSDSDINRGGLREMYGGSTLLHYLSEYYPAHDDTPELARTSHFPFHAVRKGNELFVDFLDNLGFGDYVGLVSYDQERRIEDSLVEDGVSIDISSEPVSDHYDKIKTIMTYKQASNYYERTNIGGGIRESIAMLDNHGRAGARPTILLMTDGNANVHENEAGVNSIDGSFAEDGFYEMPVGFDWSSIEFGDGTTYEIDDDGSYENKARMFALAQALKAADKGYTVHTLAVGAGADRDLMRAIAILGGGEYISVEGDLSVADLLDEVEAGFYRIAALVPPARLANPDEVTP